MCNCLRPFFEIISVKQFFISIGGKAIFTGKLEMYLVKATNITFGFLKHQNGRKLGSTNALVSCLTLSSRKLKNITPSRSLISWSLDIVFPTSVFIITGGKAV